MKQNKILEVKNLEVSFKTYAGKVYAVRNISFDLYEGEILAIVGESGSGKSVTAKAIMGILAKNANIESGKILFNEENLLDYTESEMVDIRGSEIAMIFQDPLSSLNPIMKIGNQIMEAMILKKKFTRAAVKRRALELMEAVGIPEPKKRFEQYPFQFSGGMRQRIVIAIALANDPKILICDEPTTALDVTIQAQVLELIKEIQRNNNLSVIFITHDLGVVANVSQRVCVMYAGKILEWGRIDELFYDPKSPYSWALLTSIPDIDTRQNQELFCIKGSPPNMLFPPKGDSFAPRNRYALKIDFKREPPQFKISETHYAATWLLHEKAPKVELPELLRTRIAKRKMNQDIQSDNKDVQYDSGHIDKNRVVLEVNGLKQHFKSGIGKNKLVVKAVDGIDFKIFKGETFGLVGESGCGKTTTGRTIIRLHRPTSGEVYFNGNLISIKLDPRETKEVTKGIQMIFQDPIASLNPRMTVGEIISECLKINKLCRSQEEINEKVYETLEIVGLTREHASRYPHEFSGGQRQRIGIARSIITQPDLIIADEPISALDVSIQAQVLNLMNDLKKKFGLTILFIAHDLSVVKYFSDRIAVMNDGKIIETADSRQLFKNPVHPYTQSLLSAIPVPDPDHEKNRKRQFYSKDIHNYENETPEIFEVEPNHFVCLSQSELRRYQNQKATSQFHPEWKN